MALAEEAEEAEEVDHQRHRLLQYEAVVVAAVVGRWPARLWLMLYLERLIRSLLERPAPMVAVLLLIIPQAHLVVMVEILHLDR
jgi:hypothetical protein